MDQKVLVDSQIRAGARLARDLAEKNFPVRDIAWSQFEDGWQLEIVTPLVDEVGRRSAYVRLYDAIDVSRYPEIDFEYVLVRAPEAGELTADPINDRGSLTMRARTGLAVAGSAIERFSYNLDPLVYEARISQALRQILKANEFRVQPDVTPRVDFLAETPSGPVYIEAKVRTRHISAHDVIEMVGLSTLLSGVVVLVTPNDLSQQAEKLLERAEGQVRAVRWRSDDDDAQLAAAIGL